MDHVKYSDLTEDELRFLIGMHNAPPEVQRDVFAMLINNRRRPDGGDETSDERGVVVNFEDLKQPGQS